MLDVSLRNAPAAREPLFLESGQEMKSVESLRYLGVLFDKRLNFEAHWTSLASSSKRAVGAISRLVRRNPEALRHLYQERIASVFLHSLPFTPPTTQAGWRRLNGVASFTSHLITNSWRVHGLEAISAAGLTSPAELCFTQAMRFLWSCQSGRRAFGRWLMPEEREERVRLLRSQALRRGHELQVPQSHTSTWTSLQPCRMLQLWNSLPMDPCWLPLDAPQDGGTPQPRKPRSLDAFTAALPQLFRSLPPHLKSGFHLHL